MRVATTTLVLLMGLLSAGVFAKSGSEVLDDVRDDARRDAENAVRVEVSKRFPYNGSLYGLPGQTRSDSIRESAIRAALGGLFGTCKKAGTIDLGNLPGGLNMDVGGILANTEIKVPDIKPPASGGVLSNLGGLIPKPTEAAKDQVKVGGTWMPTKDYNAMVAETQAALRRQAEPAPEGKSNPTAAAPAAARETKPAVSRVWASQAR